MLQERVYLNLKATIWMAMFFVMLVCTHGCVQTESEPGKLVLTHLDSINDVARKYLKVDLDSAKLLSESVLNQAELNNDLRSQARAQLVLGRVYYERGTCDSSIWMFRSALSISYTLKDTTLIGKSFSSISTAYMCTRNFEKARLYCDSAYSMLSTQNEYELMAKAATNCAICHIQLERYDVANERFAKAIYHAKQSSNSGFLVTLYNNYGLFNRDFGSKDTGTYYLNKALSLARSAELHVSLATIYLNYGQDLQQENPELSSSFLDSALQLSKRYDLSDLEEITLGAIAISLRDQNKPADIVGDAYERYVEKVKDNKKQAHLQSFEEFEVKYQIAEKEAENLRLLNQIQAREGSQRLIIFISVVLGFISLFIICSLFQSRKLAIRDRQIYRQKVDAMLKTQEIQNIDIMLESQSNERTRIATELHDRLGSILSAVKLNFSSMEEHFGKKQESAKVRFDVLKKLIDEAASEVRKTSHDLASGVLAKFGLMHAIEHVIKAIEASGKIKINLFAHGMDERLSGQQEIVLYRILQELVSNALKHGVADIIDVHLIKEDGKVRLIVEDNGSGFDKENIERSHGLGIPNIRKRIETVGGSFTIDSNEKSGTTVILELPIIT